MLQVLPLELAVLRRSVQVLMGGFRIHQAVQRVGLDPTTAVGVGSEEFCVWVGEQGVAVFGYGD